MSCCNFSCDQGRKCPARRPIHINAIDLILGIVCLASLCLAVFFGIAATGGFARLEEIKAVEADKLEAIRAAQLRKKFERAASALCGENAAWTEVEPGTVQCLTKHARRVGQKVAL